MPDPNWRIERKIGSGSWEVLEESIGIAEFEPDKFEYEDDHELQDGEQHYYRVKNVDDDSGWLIGDILYNITTALRRRPLPMGLGLIGTRRR